MRPVSAPAQGPVPVPTPTIKRGRIRERVGKSGWATPGTVIAMTVLFLVAVYFLIPVFWVIVSSTKSTGTLFSSFGLWFAHEFVLGDNLGHLFTYDGAVFPLWLGNTFLYAGVSAIVGTFLSAMGGYALAKYAFPGRGLVFGVILGAVIVPTTVLALPLYLLMHTFSLTNTYWAVLLPSIANPFGVYLTRIYVASSLPDDLIDAGRIDGAGEFLIFLRIGLPSMLPALVTVFLFQFVAVWNNFFLPLIMLSNRSLYPVTLGLFTWNSNASYAGAPPFLYSIVVTGALVSIIPLVIGFAFLQRFWQGGFAVGGVKA